VVDGPEPAISAALVDGKPGVLMMIGAQYGSLISTVRATAAGVTDCPSVCRVMRWLTVSMKPAHQRITLQTEGQSVTPAAVARTVLINEGGASVVLGDGPPRRRRRPAPRWRRPR
jgi:hypothetical protein